MKIAILGFGIQGRSAYEFFHSKGHDLTVCIPDGKTDLPKEAKSKVGPDYLKELGGFDLIVRSPIVHPKDIVAANSSEITKKVTTPTNEFFKVCPTRNIIGVTGTKGKGTTSTLITRMLEEDGKRVHLGGNIGISPLDLLKNNIKPEDWVVLELANFQLIDLKYSPPIAVCLLVAPEHLDWHTDVKEYVTAKQQLFIRQTKDDTAIYYAKNSISKEVAEVSPGKKIPYYESPGAEVKEGKIVIDSQDICKTDELKLLGTHNWQNVCAAVTAVWDVIKSVGPIRKALVSFTGLEHRLELVRELDGVKYYNDSFAAHPDAAAAAIEAIPEIKVLILGGFDRQLQLDNLAKTVKSGEQNIRKIILIGSSAERIAKEMEGVGYTNYEINTSKTLKEIVARAKELAKNGDAIVFSPGFPSFDMFKNFEERGILYKNEVTQL